MQQRRSPYVPPGQVKTVSASGGGQFTTIKAALDSITDASASKRYTVLVFPGTYQETNDATGAVLMKAFVDIIGVDQSACVIDCVNATTAATGVLLASNTRLSNLKILGKTISQSEQGAVIMGGATGGETASVQDVEIDRVWTTGRDWGVHLNGTSGTLTARVNITNCRFDAPQPFWFQRYVDNCTVTKCSQNYSGSVFQCFGPADLQGTNCRVTHCFFKATTTSAIGNSYVCRFGQGANNIFGNNVVDLTTADKTVKLVRLTGYWNALTGTNYVIGNRGTSHTTFASTPRVAVIFADRGRASPNQNAPYAIKFPVYVADNRVRFTKAAASWNQNYAVYINDEDDSGWTAATPTQPTAAAYMTNIHDGTTATSTLLIDAVSAGLEDDSTRLFDTRNVIIIWLRAYGTKTSRVQTHLNLAAADNVSVYASSIALDAATGVHINAALAEFRNVRARQNAGVGNVADLTVHGWDWQNRYLNGLVTFSGTGIGDTSDTAKAFAKVWFAIPGPTLGASGDTCTLGAADIFGLYHDIAATGDVIAAAKGSNATVRPVIAAPGTVSAVNGTVNCATVTANDDLEIFYNTPV